MKRSRCVVVRCNERCCESCEDGGAGKFCRPVNKRPKPSPLFRSDRYCLSLSLLLRPFPSLFSFLFASHRIAISMPCRCAFALRLRCICLLGAPSRVVARTQPVMRGGLRVSMLHALAVSKRIPATHRHKAQLPVKVATAGQSRCLSTSWIQREALRRR